MNAASALMSAALLACAAPAPAALASPGFVEPEMDPPATASPCATASIYCPTGLPDRVMLTPGADAARAMIASWRTDERQDAAEAQIRLAIDTPVLHRRAPVLDGETRLLETTNGPAHVHQVRFDDLEPDTVYAYRLRGADGWSEWFQFRTATEDFQPFRFIYFGDLQNHVRASGSRVVRQAFRATAAPALVVHAGDQVQQRDSDPYDDEWGEWFAAHGYNLASAPQIVAAGNHEYVRLDEPDGDARDVLVPHWPAHMPDGGNGAPGLGETTRIVDHQGVRFIVLDSTSALSNRTVEAQTEWLEAALEGSAALWTIVIMHHPVFSCSRDTDRYHLNHSWRPLFASHGVDLVLQGHDHCYSRMRDPDLEDGEGPVYLVSVAGPKMYSLNERARTRVDRVAQDTQLYQVIEVDQDRIDYTAYTASGMVYDGFTLTRDEDGRRLVEETADLPEERFCDGEDGPDAGVECVGR